MGDSCSKKDNRNKKEKKSSITALFQRVVHTLSTDSIIAIAIMIRTIVITVIIIIIIIIIIIRIRIGAMEKIQVLL